MPLTFIWGKAVDRRWVLLCIDTTLDLPGSMLGRHVTDETARIMEYQRAWQANRDGFCTGRGWAIMILAKIPTAIR
jgi:hypothetical protein